MDEDGNPIKGADVGTLSSNQFRSSVKTGADGRFSLYLSGSTSTIVVIYDDSATPGYDYLPAKVMVSGTAPDVVVNLVAACSVQFTGVIQFVETESLSQDVTYSVLKNGDVVFLSGLPLSYTKNKPAIQIPGWDPLTVIMPVGYTDIKISFSLKKYNPTGYIQNSFVIQIPVAEQGESLEYDLTAFMIPWNIEYVTDYLNETKTKLAELKESLFYLSKEAVMLSGSESKLEQSVLYYSGGDYTASYATLKNAFMTIRQVKQTLETLNSEAYRSIYLILGFLAISSITIGFILFESKALSLLSGLAFFSVSAGILYSIYPGTMLISFNNYLLGAGAAIVAGILLSMIVPRLIGFGAVRGDIRLMAVLVPIYTLAKRMMKRRRVRTFLTIFSVTLLTMSFVTLTSLSEEYGVSLNRVHLVKVDGRGIMITASPVTSDTDLLYVSEAEYNWLQELTGIKSIATKYTNLPQRRAIATLRSGEVAKQIFGVIGIDSAVEDNALDISKTLIEGTLPGEGEVAVTKIVLDSLSLNLGDRINLAGNSLVISGVFDDFVLGRMTELDGQGYLPVKEVNISSPEEPPHYIQVICEPEEVLVVDYRTAQKMNGVFQVRLNLGFESGVELESLAERIALERGFQATSASENAVTTYLLGAYLEGKGLPLIIPWTIAVLSVIVTMMNALHERRREINIMSSVGLNPSHIAGVFVSEATITGFVAGGIGYLFGLSLYRILALMGVAFEVEQKVSAMWSLASVGLAISAVLVGAAVALKNSVEITPSLTRKWDMPTRKMKDKPHEIVIPVKLNEAELDDFTQYVYTRLKAMEADPDYPTSSVKLRAEDHRQVITYIYKTINAGPGMMFTQNTLIIDPNSEKDYTVTLYITGETDWARRSGSVIRRLAIQWSDSKNQN
ncbi:ABC transporter permease [Candidatus Bathyarchaeota archaeon]|nr:ABC transporter permease [Candidatus Bathyarchaeota archaeon]